MKYFLLVLVFLLLLIIVVLAFFHYRTQHQPTEARFLQGKVPSPLPDGFYEGVSPKGTSWMGKKFDRAAQTGVNVFTGNKELYTFKTYIAKGAVDPKINVLKIDYNMPGNPLWLRPVLDEVVEVEPNHYLGKLNVHILPGTTIALGYFELEKKN